MQRLILFMFVICVALPAMALEDFNNPFTSDFTTRALWHFDETSGDTIAVDASSYNHDGKLDATVATTTYPLLDPSESWSASKSGFGNCLTTWWNSASDSNTGLIEVDDPANTLNMGGSDITIEFWMNPQYGDGSIVKVRHSGS